MRVSFIFDVSWAEKIWVKKVTTWCNEKTSFKKIFFLTKEITQKEQSPQKNSKDISLKTKKCTH